MRKVSNVLGILLLVAGSSAIALAQHVTSNIATNAVSTPEIDAASAGSAIALVSGMVLMFRARRAK